jgi:hypothetical protein
MKNNKTLGIIVAVIVVIGVIYLIARPKAEAPVVPVVTDDTTDTTTQTPTGATPVSKQSALLMSGDVASLVSFSVVPNTKIVHGAQIIGSLKNSYFFEGNAVGKLLDKNKKVLKTFGITATSNWMTTGPVSFSFTYDTASGPVGPGYIRLQNDNPSGDPAKVKYVDIPVIF